MPNSARYFLVCLIPYIGWGQGILRVTVADASGGAIAQASVQVLCPGQSVTERKTGTEGSAEFEAAKLGCRVRVSASGLQAREEQLREGTQELTVVLRAAAQRTEVTVSASEELRRETVSTQTALRSTEISQVPVMNRATGLTDILTRTTPGVSADSNGFAHPLGEHADTSISLDGQPITDQQAKIFANQIDPNIIQTMVATTGAPAAEFGGKTSLVVDIMTKSGLGESLRGSVASDYGSFGTAGGSADVTAGGEHWGTFLAVQGGGSGRFLDTPESLPMHAHGNSWSVFDRSDWQPTIRDSIHLNAGAGRSWFETPNSLDAAALGQDQRSQIRNLNLALGWHHTFRPDLAGFAKLFYRRERAQYFPSTDLLADQPATLAQDRTLTNIGLRADLLWSHRSHTVKLGSTLQRTSLREGFSVGLTTPDDENPSLWPYNLTRGGQLFRFRKAARIEEEAVYLQDEMRFRRLLVNAGVRYDRYNGLSRGRQIGPRLGVGWFVPGTHTMLRASYARLFETPYNENLIFANDSGSGSATDNPFASFRAEPVRPGVRNQFNTGLQQRFGKHMSVDAGYYWKFTDTAFDFDTLFNTPITFSVAWRKSKIDGWTVQWNWFEARGFSATTVVGHVRSRFFTPQVGGLIFNSTPGSGVFRIDHGEELEQSTQARYQWPARWVGGHRIWLLGAWRYNSGLALPDTVPTYLDALQLTGNQQAQIGLRCGMQAATVMSPIRTCSEADFAADRIRIPKFGTQNDDLNPVRVSPRSLFDFSAGDDRLVRRDRFSVAVRFTVLNATNKVALYNFLSTFSGTHFVPPRTYQAGLRITF